MIQEQIDLLKYKMWYVINIISDTYYEIKFTYPVLYIIMMTASIFLLVFLVKTIIQRLKQNISHGSIFNPSNDSLLYTFKHSFGK